MEKRKSALGTGFLIAGCLWFPLGVAAGLFLSHLIVYTSNKVGIDAGPVTVTKSLREVYPVGSIVAIALLAWIPAFALFKVGKLLNRSFEKSGEVLSRAPRRRGTP